MPPVEPPVPQPVEPPPVLPGQPAFWQQEFIGDPPDEPDQPPLEEVVGQPVEEVVEQPVEGLPGEEPAVEPPPVPPEALHDVRDEYENVTANAVNIRQLTCTPNLEAWQRVNNRVNSDFLKVREDRQELYWIDLVDKAEQLLAVPGNPRTDNVYIRSRRETSRNKDSAIVCTFYLVAIINEENADKRDEALTLLNNANKKLRPLTSYYVNQARPDDCTVEAVRYLIVVKDLNNPTPFCFVNGSEVPASDRLLTQSDLHVTGILQGDEVFKGVTVLDTIRANWIIDLPALRARAVLQSVDEDRKELDLHVVRALCKIREQLLEQRGVLYLRLAANGYSELPTEDLLATALYASHKATDQALLLYVTVKEGYQTLDCQLTEQLFDIDALQQRTVELPSTISHLRWLLFDQQRKVRHKQLHTLTLITASVLHHKNAAIKTVQRVSKSKGEDAVTFGKAVKTATRTWIAPFIARLALVDSYILNTVEAHLLSNFDSYCIICQNNCELENERPFNQVGYSDWLNHELQETFIEGPDTDLEQEEQVKKLLLTQFQHPTEKLVVPIETPAAEDITVLSDFAHHSALAGLKVDLTTVIAKKLNSISLNCVLADSDTPRRRLTKKRADQAVTKLLAGLFNDIDKPPDESNPKNFYCVLCKEITLHLFDLRVKIARARGSERLPTRIENGEHLEELYGKLTALADAVIEDIQQYHAKDQKGVTESPVLLLIISAVSSYIADQIALVKCAEALLTFEENKKRGRAPVSLAQSTCSRLEHSAQLALYFFACLEVNDRQLDEAVQTYELERVVLQASEQTLENTPEIRAGALLPRPSSPSSEESDSDLGPIFSSDSEENIAGEPEAEAQYRPILQRQQSRCAVEEQAFAPLFELNSGTAILAHAQLNTPEPSDSPPTAPAEVPVPLLDFSDYIAQGHYDPDEASLIGGFGNAAQRQQRENDIMHHIDDTGSGHRSKRQRQADELKRVLVEPDVSSKLDKIDGFSDSDEFDFLP